MNYHASLTIIILGSLLRYLPALFVLYLILKPRRAVVTGYVYEHDADPSDYFHQHAHI